MAGFGLKRLYNYGDTFFDLNITYLTIVGIWHNENWTRNQKILYKIYELFLHILGLTFLVMSFIGTYSNIEDIAVVLADVDKSLVSYNFVLKVIVFLFRRGDLRKLVVEMIASGDTMAKEHKILMTQLSVASTVISTTIVTIFTFLAMLAGELPIKLWLPFDTTKNFTNLLAGLQISFVTFGAICFRGLAIKCFVSTMIFYLRDQLIDVQIKIKALKYSRDLEEEMRTNFKNIVKKHIRLMRFCKIMDNLLKEYFFVQNMAITIELCVNAVILTLIGFQQKSLAANFLAFLVMALIHAFVYCYLGNEIITQSEGIATAAYNACWTTWPIDLQKDLLTMVVTAQRPLTLSAAGIAVMSLQTYGQTLYNGYSIFAVLNDVVN